MNPGKIRSCYMYTKYNKVSDTCTPKTVMIIGDK